MGDMRVRAARVVLCVSLALGAAACGEEIQTPTTPTEPTTVTETFSGTVTVNGAVTHPFATTTTGLVTVTLASLSPEGATVGLSLGTWNGASCAIIIANDQAVRTSVVTGTVTTVGGLLCARVYDVGRMTEAASYEVSVTHP